MEMKTIQRREKRWARRGCLLSLFGYLPLRICMSLLRCPEKRTRGTEGWGKAKKVDREKVGKAGMSGTVSHCLTLVSCPFFDARNGQRKRERGGEGKSEKKKKKVSNSSDRGTPQRTLSTHGNTCFFCTKYKTQAQCTYITFL